MKIDIVRECEVAQTPRVVQVSGMFDVPVTEKSRVELRGDLPLEERPWNVGLIVGPSGSGKTTVARELFGAAMVKEFDWPADRSLLDGFPEGCGIKTVTGMLSAVGFGTVPNWLRPFAVLSNGEQFRATIARALAETNDLVVIDEFTSVVDRQVAQIASNSVQKAIRRAKRQLVAVSCHYDILEWLQPDWVFEPHLAAFEWRSLCRRPEIAVEIRTASKELWPIFSKYHYLSANLLANAKCVAAFIGDKPIAFSSAYKFIHRAVKNIMMGHRLVVLPDYQGLGIGGMLDDWLGGYLWERGWRYHNVVAHPAMIAYYSRSPRWLHKRSGTMSSGGRRGIKSFRKHQTTFSARRVSSTFQYLAPFGTPSVAPPKPLDL